MRLNDIRDNSGAHRPRKRIGRGIGSGTGKTSTKGHKGQHARSGAGMPKGFEGGQMPLYRRLPKRGFKNPFRLTFVEVNLGRLQRAIDEGRLVTDGVIDEKALRSAGLFKQARDGVRLLAKGVLTTPISLKVTGASKAAIESIEKLGGQVTVTGAVRAATAAESSTAPSSDAGA